MFIRIPVVAISLLAACPLLAVATPWGSPTTKSTPAPTPTPAPTCSTGPVQCCNQVQSAGSKNASLLLGLLGIVLGDLNVPIGIACTPISIIGVGGNNCNAQTVCCENNSFHGVVAIGCSPINIGL